MKLLYITNGITGAGGLERVLSVKASALAEEYGYDITIATLNEDHYQPFYTFSPKVQFKTFYAAGNPLTHVFQYRNAIQSFFKSKINQNGWKVKPTESDHAILAYALMNAELLDHTKYRVALDETRNGKKY